MIRFAGLLPLVGTRFSLRPAGAPREAITHHEVVAPRVAGPSGRTVRSGLRVLKGGGYGLRGRSLEIEARGGCDEFGCRRGACGLGASGLEALAAEHRAALSRLEGHRSLDVALGALSSRFGAGERRSGDDTVWSGACAEDCAFGLAGLAALGVVLELFVEEEDLLTGSEDKLTVAIHAIKKPVNELCLHRILRRAGKIEHPVWPVFRRASVQATYGARWKTTAPRGGWVPVRSVKGETESRRVIG